MRLVASLCFAAVAFAQTPRVVSRTEPSYSEEARRARISTTIILNLVVNTDGIPENVQVVRPAGFGLDEQAVQAVKTWRFAPGARQAASVEVAFQLLGADGITRLNFTLAPGVGRPELLRGKMPPSPKEGDSLRIALSVGTDGAARDISVLDSSSPKWAEDAIRVMKDWRFRPASEEVKGIFELTRPARTLPAITSNPSPPVSSSSPTQSYTVDASIPAPKLISPVDGTVFENGSPRRTSFQWEPSPGAVSYLFEWDYSYNGVWDAEANKRLGMGFPVQGTQYSLDFVGAQPGRWRVWPVSAAGPRGLPSEWRGFKYLK